MARCITCNNQPTLGMPECGRCRERRERYAEDAREREDLLLAAAEARNVAQLREVVRRLIERVWPDLQE